MLTEQQKEEIKRQVSEFAAEKKQKASQSRKKWREKHPYVPLNQLSFADREKKREKRRAWSAKLSLEKKQHYRDESKKWREKQRATETLEQKETRQRGSREISKQYRLQHHATILQKRHEHQQHRVSWKTRSALNAFIDMRDDLEHARESRADFILDPLFKARTYTPKLRRTPEELALRRRAVARAYIQRPEVKERRRSYYSRPEIRARTRIYNKEYYSRPEVIARQREHQRKYDRSPNRILKKANSSTALDEIYRYLENRQRVFNIYKNSSRGLMRTRNMSMPAWKQRLHEMDEIFMDELVQNALGTSLSLETLSTRVQQHIDTQDKKLEALSLNAKIANADCETRIIRQANYSPIEVIRPTQTAVTCDRNRQLRRIASYMRNHPTHSHRLQYSASSLSHCKKKSEIE